MPAGPTSEQEIIKSLQETIDGLRIAEAERECSDTENSLLETISGILEMDERLENKAACILSLIEDIESLQVSHPPLYDFYKRVQLILSLDNEGQRPEVESMPPAVETTTHKAETLEAKDLEDIKALRMVIKPSWKL